MMKTKTSSHFFTLLNLVTFLFVSCQNEVTLVDTNQKTNHLKWGYADKVRIPVKVGDTKRAYTFYLNLRHTGDYKYSNIFILIHQIGPDGKKTSERKEFTLALPDGEWLGTGSGSLYSHQMVFRKDYHFPQKGTYIFEIEQNMRENPLHELSDIGIRIEENNRK